MQTMTMDLKSSNELSPFLLRDVKRTNTILGMGSFGSVEEVTLNGAPCAGKKMHDVLMQSQNLSKKFLVKKMVEECQLMSQLKHPNIVQFFGLYFFESSPFPMIVMEKLNSNLDSVLTGHRNMPIALKNIIMQDITKGLNYLHAQLPPIIHRDITARNVLLTSSMTAKLGDLGSARIIQAHGISSTLSQMPGTLVYMPPEAFQIKPSYDAALDIFSFGHLVLFIILQECPAELLPHTYSDPKNPGVLLARTEAERRKKYVDQCIDLLGRKSPIITLIQSCLDNDPQKRPSATQILKILLERESAEQQMYGDIRQKLDHTIKVENTKFEDGDVPEHSNNKLESDSLSQQLLHHIKNGEPVILDMWTTSKHRFLRRDKQEQWEQFVFRLENSTHVRFYRDLKKKPLGEIQISCVTYIKKKPHRYNYPFEIHFEGKNSPWTLKAKTGDVRNCWMESIVPRSSSQLEPVCLANEYEDVVIRSPPDERATNEQHKLQQKKVQPMYPTKPEKAQTDNETQFTTDDTEVTYSLPFHGKPNGSDLKYKDFDYQTLLGDFTYNQYQDYTDVQLKQMATVLQNALKQIQGNMQDPQEVCNPQEQNQDHAGRFTDSKQRYQNEPRERQDALKSALQQHDQKNDSKLDTIFESNVYEPIPEAMDKNAIPVSDEIPPPLPIKRRKLRLPATPKKEPAVQINVNGVSNEEPDFPSNFRERSGRRETIRRMTNINEQLQKHMHPVSKNGAVESSPWARASTSSDFNFASSEKPSELSILDKSSIQDMILIGAGEFGRVYKGTLSVAKGKSIEVAVKGVIHKTEKEERDFQKEMAIMSKIMHPNVVRFYGMIAHENMVVLELMLKGDLKTFLQENPRPVTKLVKFMNDIVMGMHHISGLKLVHRDLAARNILVSENETCKVADLGQMIELPQDGEQSHIVTDTTKIPVRWCSPEYLKEKKCSVASDVWSFGVVMWEMANPGMKPYRNYNSREAMREIKSGRTLEIPSWYPKNIQNIMTSCWSFEPEKRPSFLYIFMHLNRVN